MKKRTTTTSKAHLKYARSSAAPEAQVEIETDEDMRRERGKKQSEVVQFDRGGKHFLR